MESVRQQKIAKLIQKELAEIFRANAKSLFEGAFITVTIVRISPDLGYAKVYLSIMSNKNINQVFDHLNLQKNHIRKMLGMQIGKQVRVIPELTFFIDDSYDYAEKINQLLNKPI